MIVDPDFCDHWKTRLLVGLLNNDEAAPMYVLRIWAHCQNRRQWEFDNLTKDAIKALCRFTGDADELENALAKSGFIERDGANVTACGWGDYNSSLVAAWSNGSRGGRPRKPNGQNHKPTGYSKQRKPKPTGSRLDKSREEKIREETPLPPSLDSDSFRSAWADWKRHRTEIKKPLKPTMEAAQLKEFGEWGQDRAIAAIRYTIRMGWQGIREPESNGKEKTITIGEFTF